MDKKEVERIRVLLAKYDAAEGRLADIEQVRKNVDSVLLGAKEKFDYMLEKVESNEGLFYGFLEEFFAEWLDKAKKEALRQMKEVTEEIEAL